MSSLNSDQKNYIKHTLLRHIGLSISYSYGALLLYDITGSVLSVLFLGFIGFSAGFLMRSFGTYLLLKLQNRFDATPLMGVGLSLMAGVNALLFLFQDAFHGLLLLSALLIVWNIGSGMYWIFSSFIKYSGIGLSGLPGRYSSYLTITHVAASILVGVLSIYLGLRDNFLLLLVLSAGVLFVSLYPLTKIKLLKKRKFSFSLKNVLIHTPPLAQAANFNVFPEFINWAIPLYLLLVFGGLLESITLTSASLIITAVLSYAAGNLKDKGNNYLLALAGISGVVGILLLTQVRSAFLVVAVLVLINVAWQIVGVGSDTRLGKDIVSSSNNLEAMVGIELMHILGGMTGLFIFFIIFLIFNTIPAWSFALGIIFWLPRAVYSLR